MTKIICLLSIAISGYAFAGMTVKKFSPLNFGFTPIQLITADNYNDFQVDPKKSKSMIEHFCKSVEIHFDKFKWDKNPCGSVKWQADLISGSGHPLIYTVFGEGEKTTLLLGGVHPDELTPIPIAFRFARHLQQHPNQVKSTGARVIIAPLVNPDGFLRNVPTRNNANGVDLNRNFFTFDWYKSAKKLWQSRGKRKQKYFPGYFPNSEVETLFQIGLVDQFHPDKIMSIHAPLGFLDYDGPGDRKPNSLSATERKARQLVYSISEKARNYRVVDYSFYPGSLGNFAGNERKIPTITLELETTDPKKVDRYWSQFLPGMIQSVKYPFSTTPGKTGFNNTTPFSRAYKKRKTI